jgi:FkbM family methyltransferase
VSFTADGQAFRLRVPGAMPHGFEYQFADNGQAAEEMFGFVRAARSARTLFDVGAFHGLFSVVFGMTGPGKTAVAFEPSAEAVAHLKSFRDLNGQGDGIVIENRLIGREVGEIRVALMANGFVQTNPAKAEGVEIVMSTLDCERDRLGIQPDLVKIDVEGWEWEVLQGSERLLRECRPAVCLELHMDYLERRGIAPSTVLDYLSKLGYQFYSPMGSKLPAAKIAGSANVLYRLIARPA